MHSKLCDAVNVISVLCNQNSKTISRFTNRLYYPKPAFGFVCQLNAPIHLIKNNTAYVDKILLISE